MPGFDRTGPLGYGPVTGRGLGPCGRGMAFGRGPGMGFGRGRRRFFSHYPYGPAFGYQQAPAYTKEDELAGLRADKELAERELRALQDELKALDKRISEMEK